MLLLSVAVAALARGVGWRRWRSRWWMKKGCWPWRFQIGVDAYVLRIGSVSAGWLLWKKKRKREKRKDGGEVVTRLGEKLAPRTPAALGDRPVSSLACIRPVA